MEQNQPVQEEHPPTGFYVFLGIVGFVTVLVVGYLVASYFM